MELTAQIRLEARKELARRDFYDYCRLRYPKHYPDDRAYLRSVCQRVQAFGEQNEKRFLIINMPPRHYKSFTAGNFVEWRFGADPTRKVMTGSYNETLSTTFARKVRDTIDETQSRGVLVYRDIFPNTRVKYGQAAMNKWSLEGSGQDNYLATSPTGTATGFGANDIVIDDIIKNDKEAYNDLVLDGHWSWFCLTGDTQVSTPLGKRYLKDIGIGDEVLTYNHSQCKIDVRRVKKVKNKVSEIYRLKFSNGSEIKTTADHHFYTNLGYKPVSEILQAMWGELEPGQNVLFPDVPQPGPGGETAKGTLSELPEDDRDRASESSQEILFYGLSTFTPDEVVEVTLRDVERRQGSSEGQVRQVSEVRPNQKLALPSHRSQLEEQSVGEPDGTLPIVPYSLSQATRLSPDDAETVYDIEVEGNHNFFANDILVHNCNTMLSRTEGDDWKVYVFMTRWAQGDLAGRIIDAYGDQVEVITHKAVQDDGSMLCESVLNRSDYDLKTKEMNLDIVEANYNQKPIDISGRLYSEFGVYDSLPSGQLKKWNYTDTADKGADFLCSIDYVERDGDVYVTDVVFTDAGMEETEPAVAEMLDADEVDEATIESNNGGRGFARNVERELQARKNRKCVVRWVAQTANKEARILASSAWVNRHIYMPHNWKNRWPEFHRQLMSYQKKGKNKHDDGPDVLAAIYEKVANPRSTFRVRTA